ncbi:MAG TPA: protein translocase subunit SecD [Nitrospiraceae bacterium]|nr:protein translocase subunit SecD [Nitrospiraceae bacterium]
MLKSLKFRFTLVLIFLIVSVIFCLPNVIEPQGKLKKYLPSDKIHLGLDLKGGRHLLLELDTVKLMQNMIDRKFGALKDAMIRDGIRFMALDKHGNTLSVSVRAEQKDKLYNLIGRDFPDLKAGDSKAEGDILHLTFLLPDKEVAGIKENAVKQALETIRNRIDQFGVTEPVIVQQGESQILVQLPGIKDPQRALELIGRTAQLEFKLVDEDNIARSQAGSVPDGSEVLTMRSRNRDTGVYTTSQILLKKQAVLTGELLTDAKVRIGGEFNNEPYVAIEFDSEGARIFDKITAESVGKRLAIILDNTVYSAPVIKERISGGKASITGGFTMEEAKDLAIVLKAGALPAPVKMLQNITVGPSLGTDSIEAGKMAGIIGTLLVVVFMIVYYRLSGVIADLALALNIILLLGAMASLNATLTMPGIAGIILAIGMAVDSNVLMFERIRDELRAGKTPRAAVDSGYNKAFWTIFDSHVTTLITAAVLFQFGTGPIKGFAVTLSLGVAINLFTALVGTKSVFDLILSRRDVRKLSI